jgi:hypothetical protein
MGRSLGQKHSHPTLLYKEEISLNFEKLEEIKMSDVANNEIIRRYQAPKAKPEPSLKKTIVAGEKWRKV